VQLRGAVNLQLCETGKPRDIGDLRDLFIRKKHLWLTCWGKLFLGSAMRKMARSLMPFAEENKICFFDDNIFIWYALKNFRNYVALDMVGYKYIAMDGIGVKVTNTERVDGMAAVQRKIVFDEKTPDGRAMAREFTRRHDWMAIGIVCSLPQREGFEAFSRYLASVPPPFDGDIRSEMGRRNRAFLESYVEYEKTVKL
jgi:hypothetical protein